MSVLEKLRQDLLDVCNVSYEDACKKFKELELKDHKSLHNEKYYRDKVFNIVSDDALNTFEFVETPEQHDLWNTFRCKMSSVRCFKNVGRNVRMLVKEKETQLYIGILSLGSDIACYQARDDYIGWDKQTMFQKKRLNYVMNINCCVGLQPCAYNYNFGKLLVALCYSKEVHDYLNSKYGHNIACLTTFSINGKSIQYDRMVPYLQLIGYTKGMGNVKVPDNIYSRCLKVLTKVCDKYSLRKSGRMMNLIKVCHILGVPMDVVHHNQPRGVYIGFVGKQCKEFLRGEVDTFDMEHIKPLSDMVKWWKVRWANRRYMHLKSNGLLRFKIEFMKYNQLYNNEKTKRCIEKKKEEVGEDQYKQQRAEYMKQYRASHGEYVNANHVTCKIPKPSPEYLAGLFDGDGSITVKYCSTPTLSVSIGQCHPVVLLVLFKYFGGSIRIRYKNNNSDGNKRNMFIWELNGSFCLPFLLYIKNHVVIEALKVKTSIDALESNDSVQRLQLFSAIGLYTKHSSIVKPYDRVSRKYVFGLFEAEGDLSGFRFRETTNSITYGLGLVQQLDGAILERIADLFGYGIAKNGRWHVYQKAHIDEFLKEAIPCLLIKKCQAELGIQCISATCFEIKKDLVRQMVEDRHKNYDIHDLEVLKDTISLNLSERRVREKRQLSEEHKALISEKMSGSRNPNYGKERSDAHCLKIAVSTKLAKHSRRKVSDTQILDIRRLRAEGKTNAELAEQYGVCHQYISNIVNNKVLTLDEINSRPVIVKSIKDTTQSRKLDHRKILMQVLKYHKAHDDTYNVMSDKSESLFGKKLSVHQIKNYCCGKTKVKPDEFPMHGVSYAEYVILTKCK